MKIDKIKINIISALVFLIFSIAMIWYIIPNEVVLSQSMVSDDVGVNSQTFPIFACAITGVAALGLLLTSVAQLIQYWKANKNIKNVDKINIKSELNAILIYGLFVAYGLLYMVVGFLIASLIILPIVLWVLKDKNWKHYVIAESVALGMFLIFRFALSIML